MLRQSDVVPRVAYGDRPAPLLASLLLRSPSDLYLESMIVDAPNWHMTLELTAMQAV